MVCLGFRLQEDRGSRQQKKKVKQCAQKMTEHNAMKEGEAMRALTRMREHRVQKCRVQSARGRIQESRELLECFRKLLDKAREDSLGRGCVRIASCEM